MQIIVDTNILMNSVKFKVDFFENLAKFGKPVIPDFCIEELKKLESKHKEAKIALKIIKKINIEIAKTSDSIKDIKMNDDRIIKLAKKTKSAVATNDEELIKRLKMKKIRVLRLKQKRYLSFA